ncbi:MAG TPA: hypothetical protein VHM25_24335 [Polyangiaceae bacterium]|nr:hypothetical protein [Polyangiaceae bacterium]
MTRQRTHLFEQAFEIAVCGKVHAETISRQRFELSLDWRVGGECGGSDWGD